MSTIVVLALGAALVAALGLAIDRLRRPRRGRHVSGAVPLVRGLAPMGPLVVAAIAALAMAEPLTVALSAALVWCLSVLALPATGRLSAWAHSIWSLSAAALVLALVWGGSRLTGASLSGPSLIIGALLWMIVAVAAGAALAYAWELLREAEVSAASAEGLSPGWWRPRTAMTLVWLTGVAAASGLAFVATPPPAPDTSPLASPSVIPSTVEAPTQQAPPSAPTSSAASAVERARETAASRSRRTTPAVATTSATPTAAVAATPSRSRTATRTRTSTTETTTTTPILDITFTPNTVKPTRTRPPHTK